MIYIYILIFFSAQTARGPVSDATRVVLANDVSNMASPRLVLMDSGKKEKRASNEDLINVRQKEKQKEISTVCIICLLRLFVI